MTQTPRTDAMASTMFPDGSRWVQIEFARQLERENQTFRAAQKACEDCDAPRVDRIDELERELAAANAIIASALKAMPVGYIPAHTTESLPGRVADIVGRYAEAERELAEARATHAALYAGTLKLERELAREKQRAEENGILAHDTALALATAREALEWARGELGKHTRPSPIDKALAPASDLGESNDEPGRTNELMATLAQQSAVAIQKHHSKILSERQTGLEPYGRKGKDDL